MACSTCRPMITTASMAVPPSWPPLKTATGSCSSRRPPKYLHQIPGNLLWRGFAWSVPDQGPVKRTQQGQPENGPVRCPRKIEIGHELANDLVVVPAVFFQSFLQSILVNGKQTDSGNTGNGVTCHR